MIVNAKMTLLYIFGDISANYVRFEKLKNRDIQGSKLYIMHGVARRYLRASAVKGLKKKILKDCSAEKSPSWLTVL